MKTPTVTNLKIGTLLLFCAILGLQSSFGQEEVPNLGTKSTYHNQLFFNRFLINPTFSLVRENKSYINILHRNQYATFEDNDQNYFLGFSNKLNDRTALGISVYSQWSGVVQEFGFNANYATAVRLGEKNKLTFGTNVTYFTEGLDKNRIIVADADNKLEATQKESQLAIQPGVTLSLGQFDIGLYAQELLNYNQTTNEFATNLGAKNVKASLQYTYEFMQNRGLLANARLMPMVQVGQNEDGSMNYIGSMLLDLPDYGWFQTNFDQEYGLSLGLGFNVSKKMSLGYLLERDLMNEETDLGWNHEVTLAYTLDREHNAKGLFAEGSEDEKVDRIVRNYEEQILALKEEVEKNKAALNAKDAGTQVADSDAMDTRSNSTESDLGYNADAVADRDVMEAMADMNDAEANALAYENRLILDELILRQDSIDAARSAAFDKQLAAVVDGLKKELKGNNGAPGAEYIATSQPAVASNAIKSEILKRMNADSENKTPVKAPIQENSMIAGAKTVVEPIKNVAPVIETTEAVADNALVEKTDAFEETYTRKFEFEPVHKVLGEIIAKPAVTENADTDDMKNGVKLPIKTMKKSDLVGVKSGYYVIANVFKTKKYLDAFLGDLRKKGLDAGYFYNKENGLHYVYLADYNYKSDAKTAYVSNMNGQYNADKWIMQVDNTATIVDNFYEDQ
ncbi:type IX secretion system membrane protein PorP/SprF [Pricia sp. S334]|uniref:Type IX secretion system membrane protein PorP/SprF n=1 Tax=Pricia mediterranea TaxID=3076079 RepID=A0ABU3L9N6_9FLAO|nr:type IX secretion system membrane protein PorP/SprF [Pricia sp. S334]MDT7830455.1 type IX secretion system membrane protein PorP/SprF [Pricia sp. S334]